MILNQISPDPYFLVIVLENCLNWSTFTGLIQNNSMVKMENRNDQNFEINNSKYSLNSITLGDSYDSMTRGHFFFTNYIIDRSYGTIILNVSISV